MTRALKTKKMTHVVDGSTETDLDVLIKDYKAVDLRDVNINPGAGVDGYIIYYNDSTGFFELKEETGGGSTTFLALTDTPADFSGSAGKILSVNGSQDAIVFTDKQFTQATRSAVTTVTYDGGVTFTANAEGDFGDAQTDQNPMVYITDGSVNETVNIESFNIVGGNPDQFTISASDEELFSSLLQTTGSVTVTFADWTPIVKDLGGNVKLWLDPSGDVTATQNWQEINSLFSMKEVDETSLGAPGTILKVNAEGTGLVFLADDSGSAGVEYFTDLLDTPAGFGSPNQVLSVNGTGDGLIFSDLPASGVTTFEALTDSPSGYGTTGQILASTGSGLEYIDLPASGASTFLELTDTAGSFGNSWSAVVVNGSGNGLTYSNNVEFLQSLDSATYSGTVFNDTSTITISMPDTIFDANFSDGLMIFVEEQATPANNYVARILSHVSNYDAGGNTLITMEDFFNFNDSVSLNIKKSSAQSVVKNTAGHPILRIENTGDLTDLLGNKISGYNTFTDLPNVAQGSLSGLDGQFLKVSTGGASVEFSPLGITSLSQASGQELTGVTIIDPLTEGFVGFEIDSTQVDHTLFQLGFKIRITNTDQVDVSDVAIIQSKTVVENIYTIQTNLAIGASYPVSEHLDVEVLYNTVFLNDGFNVPQLQIDPRGVLVDSNYNTTLFYDQNNSDFTDGNVLSWSSTFGNFVFTDKLFNQATGTPIGATYDGTTYDSAGGFSSFFPGQMVFITNGTNSGIEYVSTVNSDTQITTTDNASLPTGRYFVTPALNTTIANNLQGTNVLNIDPTGSMSDNNGHTVLTLNRGGSDYTDGNVVVWNSATNDYTLATPAGGGASNFTDLGDTPGTYGSPGQVVVVNGTGDGLIYDDVSGGSAVNSERITFTPIPSSALQLFESEEYVGVVDNIIPSFDFSIYFDPSDQIKIINLSQFNEEMITTVSGFQGIENEIVLISDPFPTGWSGSDSVIAMSPRKSINHDDMSIISSTTTLDPMFHKTVLVKNTAGIAVTLPSTTSCPIGTRFKIIGAGSAEFQFNTDGTDTYDGSDTSKNMLAGAVVEVINAGENAGDTLWLITSTYGSVS